MPKVTKATLIRKVFDGCYKQGWRVVGVGGSQTALIEDLVKYLESKGVEVSK